MIRTLLSVAAGVIALLASCNSQPRPPGEKKPDSAYSKNENNIRDYLSRVAAKITDAPLPQYRSLDDWKKNRERIHGEFLQMMGLDHLPVDGQRTPLNVKVTSVVHKKGYRIETLYFESLPGLYVRGNLYVPDSIKDKRPAIFYASGHSPTAKSTYQGHPMKFAQLGFVCLLTETIQFGEVLGEHWGCYRNGWFNWYSRGYNPGGAELWNDMRALDLLASRPEVDPERIGVTGISGGGSQTWYLAAADPRIKAAAAVCGAGTLKSHICTRTVDGHCDCMMFTNTYGYDFREVGALIAPRPFLIAQANRDGMYDIDAVRKLKSQVNDIYALYGKSANLSMVETPGGHSYHKLSRENIFSFFLQHLMGKKVSPEEVGDIDTVAADQATAEELRIYKNGPPKNDRTTTIQNSFITLPGTPDIASNTQLDAYRDSVKRALREKTFHAFPEKAPDFNSRLEFKSLDNPHSGNSIYSFVTEDGWRLKLDVHWSEDSSAKKPLLIVLRSPNEERWSSEGFAYNVSNDWNVAYFEVRGVGEFGWAPDLQWHIRRASAWTGRTIASMQVYDLMRCLEFARTVSNVDAEHIGVAARDEMGVVALYAALMDGKCNRVVLDNPPATQDVASDPSGRGPAIEMLNCLQITDVNRLPAILAPAKIEFLNSIPAAYDWANEISSKIKGNAFEIINEKTDN
jgi:cephalosporin-C deacetylase-like acetyl esterase